MGWIKTYRGIDIIYSDFDGGYYAQNPKNLDQVSKNIYFSLAQIEQAIEQDLIRWV